MRLALKAVISLSVLVSAFGALAAVASASAGAGAPDAPGARTLILYDSSGPWGRLGELYAIGSAHLASHFGPWTAHPVVEYTPGEMLTYDAVVYLGSTYDEPLPEGFLDDVTLGTKPVLWAGFNIWQLTAHDPLFEARYGWQWRRLEDNRYDRVYYKGTFLTRNPDAGALMTYGPLREDVELVGQATSQAGNWAPWALRSGNLTYVGEIPLSYISENDRYLAFSDLFFDLLAPATPTRHRALVRLEDIDPSADPVQLRQVADVLSARGVPFAFSVVPVFRDQAGFYSGGQTLQLALRDAPDLIAALKYMQSKGGVLVEHGYTHQLNEVNPFNGVTGDDFEFMRVQALDADYRLSFQGPVTADDLAWSRGRLALAEQALVEAGLGPARIFEFPHYTASTGAYRAVGERFTTRYERGLYFSGLLSGQPIDYASQFGQFFPYVVRDVYGQTVIPENLGNYIREPFFIYPPRSVQEILANADANLVVRDGFASFFFHPYRGLSNLTAIVDGLKARGYTFVDPKTLVAGSTSSTPTAYAGVTSSCYSKPFKPTKIAVQSGRVHVTVSTGASKATVRGFLSDDEFHRSGMSLVRSWSSGGSWLYELKSAATTTGTTYRTTVTARYSSSCLRFLARRVVR